MWDKFILLSDHETVCGSKSSSFFHLNYLYILSGHLIQESHRWTETIFLPVIPVISLVSCVTFRIILNDFSLELYSDYFVPKIIHIINSTKVVGNKKVASNFDFMYCMPENVADQVCGMWLQTHTTVPITMTWMWNATFYNRN